MQSCRGKLQQVLIQPITHAGLWLDKYLKEQSEGGGETAKKGHFEQAAKKPISDAYPIFFDRWQQSLEQAGVVTRKVQAQGRMAIGLGGESVLETSITLHRTYGVPYIPGSALKGLAARYARNHLEESWGKDKEAYKTLFGDTVEAGYVTFFDALYIPGSAKQDHPLALDVITVHHPEYYRGDDLPPADWDSPVPISFLSATGSYLVALHGAKGWVKAAFEILQLALAEEGIGAKTSSGYGRMVFEDEALKSKPDKSLSATLSTTQTTTLAPPLPRKSARGKVRYTRGRPIIVTEDGRKFFCNWRSMGMDALKGKTMVEFEYEEPVDARPRVVKVRKIWTL